LAIGTPSGLHYASAVLRSCQDRRAFRYVHLGYASALSFVLLVLILLLAALQFWVLREERHG